MHIVLIVVLGMLCCVQTPKQAGCFDTSALIPSLSFFFFSAVGYSVSYLPLCSGIFSVVHCSGIVGVVLTKFATRIVHHFFGV